MEPTVYPPGHKLHLPARCLWLLRRNPASALVSLAQQYGDIVHIQAGKEHIYLINHPDFIAQMLEEPSEAFQRGPVAARWCSILGIPIFKTDGAVYEQKDRQVKQALAAVDLEKFGQHVILAAEQASARWAAACASSQASKDPGISWGSARPAIPVEMAEEMRKLSFSIAVQALRETSVPEEAPAFLFERAAAVLTWAWFYLAAYPGASAQLQAESEAAGRPEPGMLSRLPYTTMFLSETLRLRPPVWLVGRQARRDFTAGGFIIPAESIILASPYVTHRDRRYYPDPEGFNPLRWTGIQKAGRPAYSYFPFGAGPHRCPVERLALHQALLSLAVFCRTWRARLAPGQGTEISSGFTLWPQKGLHLVLNRRSWDTP